MRRALPIAVALALLVGGTAVARDVLKADQDYGSAWRILNLQPPATNGEPIRRGDMPGSGLPCVLLYNGGAPLFQCAGIGTGLSLSGGTLSLTSIPAGTSVLGELLFTAASATVTPPTGFGRCRFDATNRDWTCIDAYGLETHGVQTSFPGGNFVTGIGPDGYVYRGGVSATQVAGLWPVALTGNGSDLNPLSTPLDRLAQSGAADGQVPVYSVASGKWIPGAAATGGITQLTGQVLAGPGSGSQATTLATNTVTLAQMQQLAGLSVLGRSASSTGNMAAITATSGSNGVLREAGGALGFGNISASVLSGLVPCGNLPALTGDVTSVGCATTVANLPNGATWSGWMHPTNTTVVGTPSAGTSDIWVDATAKTLFLRDDAGNVSHGVRTSTAGAHQFANGLSDTGVLSYAQPAATDVSGLAAIATSGSATDLITGTVPPARLGSFMNGGVFYWNGGLAQTDGDLHFDFGNTFLGIGTNTPVTKLHVAYQGTASPRGIMSAQYNTGGQGAQWVGRKARGSLSSPAVVINTDFITSLVPEGYDGSAYQQGGTLAFVVDGSVASGSVPTAMQLFTGATAQGTQRLGVSSAGAVTWPNNASFSIGSLGTGLVKSTSGLLANATSADLTNAISWPAGMLEGASGALTSFATTNGQLLYGAASGGGAASSASLTFTAATSTLTLGGTGSLALPNADNTGVTNNGWIQSSGRNLLGMDSSNRTLLNASAAAGGGFYFVTGGSLSSTLASLTNSGVFSVLGLGSGSGGLVKAAATTGAFSQALGDTDYQRPISAGAGITVASDVVSLTGQSLSSVGFTSSGSVLHPAAPTVAEWAIAPPTTATAATLSALHTWDPVTLTLTGGTHVTGNTLALARFVAPTFTDSTAVTIDKVATMIVDGGPTCAGSVACSDAPALYVKGSGATIEAQNLAGAGPLAADANGVFKAATSGQLTGAVAWPTGVLEGASSALTSFSATNGQLAYGAASGSGLASSPNLTYLSSVLALGGTTSLDMPAADGSGSTSNGWITSTTHGLIGMTSSLHTMVNLPASGGLFEVVKGSSETNLFFEVTNAGDTIVKNNLEVDGVAASSLVKTDASHNLTAASAGTDYVQTIGVSLPITNNGTPANPIISIGTMAGSGFGHARGAVPDPGSTAGTTRFLREDGSWTSNGSGEAIHYSTKLIWSGASTPTGWLVTGSDVPGWGFISGNFEYATQIAASSATLMVRLVFNNLDGTAAETMNITRNGSVIGSGLTFTPTNTAGLYSISVSIAGGSSADTYGVKMSGTGAATTGTQLVMTETLLLQ